MDLPITDGAYTSASQDANYQRCVNMYPIAAGPEGRGKYTLVPTQGTSLLTTLGLGPIRGILVLGIYTYVVSNNTVYKLYINNITGNVESNTTLGTLTTSTGTVYFASNNTQIILVDSSTSGYIITIATGAMAVIADVDFVGGSQVQFLDGYFIYFKPGTSTMYASALNDGTTWNALDSASASMRPDNIVGLGISRGELWVFGELSIEVWYDAANSPGFPLSPRIGSNLDIGCAAGGSVAAVDNLLMWLDTRGFIVQSDTSNFIRNNSSGYAVKIISTDAINNEISGYSSISDAVAFTYVDRGHIFYQISFPNANKTWVFDHTIQKWHERSYFNTYKGLPEYHLAQYYGKSNSRNVIGGIRNGNLYKMSPLYYDDNSVVIRRLRNSPPFSMDFMLMTVNRLELRMMSGVAPEGVDPQITLRYSNDGGHTWSDEMTRSFGKIGEYAKSITWNRLGTEREWMLEFTIISSVNFSIISASADITDSESMSSGSSNQSGGDQNGG